MGQKLNACCIQRDRDEHGPVEEPKVTESGRPGCAKLVAERQTHWRVWVIGGTGARPESPGLAAVSRL